MKKEIEITCYDNLNNVLSDNLWHERAKVTIKYVKKTKKIAIVANKEGFLSLASIFASFAEDEVPHDFELFLDSKEKDICGDLERDSDNVIIFKSPIL